MDFSFNSKSWAGNIYHHFESICHDVDGFVNKDSVKFVESQVQSVGSSVKRLYSNVVHDILPLSTETVKPDRQLAQICQHLREQGNDTVQSSAEKNITEDLKRATANSSFDSELFSGKLDKEDISSTPAFSDHEECSTSIEFSAHEECSTSIEKERRDLNPQEGDKGFSNDTEYHSDSLLSLSECKYTKDENVDLSTSTQSSEHAFSYNSCNEKEEQMAIVPSTFCILPESSVAMECTSADFSMGADNDLHSRSVSDGCTDNISSSSISAADKTKEVDVDPASLIMELNDDDALQTERLEFEVSSFESGEYEEHYKNVHPKIVISSSETAETENTNGLGVPIGDLDLETVELSSHVKHDGRNVVLGSNVFVPGSYRRKNFRYYKKLIQGAFTSQKRLSKEYEHLAIMYGDIDVESNRHFEPTSLLPFPNTALHLVETQNENEWELL